MLKKCTFAILSIFGSLSGCASVQSEPANQPVVGYGQTTQTVSGYAVVYSTDSPLVVSAGCGQPNGGTGLPANGPEIIYETPETAQALAASGITVAPTEVVGRGFRFRVLDCNGVRTERLIIRGSWTAANSWHVRIISANSDCSSDLIIVQNGSLTNYILSESARTCSSAAR